MVLLIYGKGNEEKGIVMDEDAVLNRKEYNLVQASLKFWRKYYESGMVTDEDRNVYFCRRIAGMYGKIGIISEETLFYIVRSHSHTLPLLPVKGP